MARTPWNFFARLIGRGAKAPTDGDKDRSTDTQGPTLRLPPPETSAEDTAGPDQVRAETTLAPVETASEVGSVRRTLIEVEPTLPEVDGAQSAIDEDTSTTEPPHVVIPTGKAAKSGKRRKTKNVGDGPFDATAPSRSLSDEVMDLDMEISLLRRELAERLRSQNAQLRQMLARFKS